MAPLILHNVPDDECYIGDDGVKRPYAMIFNQNEGHQGSLRARRAVAETGSFGKSTRRSRSRSTTAPRGARENPTLAAADKIFGDWISSQTNSNSAAPAPSRQSAQAPPSTQQEHDDAAAAVAAASQRVVASTPVEVLLRGYRSSSQQYAALAHYETLAGPVLEDYPRDPPASQRRWKSELRDPAFTRRRVLSPDERAMVNRAAGGEHWVKITFASVEAGEAAMSVSPQRVLGFMVYAEPWRGLPPAKDEACPDVDSLITGDHFERSRSVPAALGTPARTSNNMPKSFTSRLLDLSPGGDSRTSSQTLETATLSTATMTEPLAPIGGDFSSAMPSTTTSALASGSQPGAPAESDGVFCRRIPTARRARLLPAEQALLPQQSVMQRFVNAIPLVKWFGGSMIGDEVPRNDAGEFDWFRASLYWKVIWWLDATFGLFQRDVCSVDRDD